MAENQRLSFAAANLAADAVTTRLNGGFLRLYSGVQPASPETPITTQVMLAQLFFSAQAFEPAVNAVATANPIIGDPSADASGVATWFRAVEGDADTAVFDGSVGTADCNCNLNTVAIQMGASVSLSSFTYTQKRVP